MLRRRVRLGRLHRPIVALIIIALLGHAAHVRAETLGHVTGPSSVDRPASEGLFADHHAVPPAPSQAVRTAPTAIAPAPVDGDPVVALATGIGPAPTSALVRSAPLFLLHAALLI